MQAAMHDASIVLTRVPGGAVRREEMQGRRVELQPNASPGATLESPRSCAVTWVPSASRA